MRKLLYVVGLAALIASLPFLFPTVNPRDTVVILKGQGVLCSSVIIRPGQLLTAAHCVGGTTYVEYKGYKVPYTIRFVDKRQDIAFIEAVGVECPCSPVLYELPKKDETVYKYGYGLAPNVAFLLNRTLGEFQGIIPMGEGQKWMFHTAPAAPGDSGGGVFVKRWGQYYLVGITSAIATTGGMMPQLVFHMSIAVPLAIFRS